MAPTKTPLSSILPPLLFGTATFNHQYNKDPYALDTTGLVRSALEKGIRAFDTSPYYGPSESLLGAALSTPFVTANFPRDEYFLLTKVGRVASDEFDYSPEWVRASVARSLRRLQTPYLDVVYCHDVEFVSDDEVLGAVRELRRIRDADGSVRYVGISGYPVETLCRLAERVLRETGEPLDAVMSYANYTLQNTTLATQGVRRLLRAGVDVVPNASPLGMGLLRREGVPVGSMGDFHPAGAELRAAVREASDLCDMHGERLEVIAIRFALETWLHAGAAVGARGDPASGVPWKRERIEEVGGQKLGVSVMGVSQPAELDKTMMVWRSILDGLEDGQRVFADRAGRWKRAHEWSLNRKRAVQILAEGVQECLGAWVDYAWDSPDKGFVNRRGKNKQARDEGDGKQKTLKGKEAEAEAPWLTPAASPEPEAQVVVAEDRELPLR